MIQVTKQEWRTNLITTRSSPKKHMTSNTAFSGPLSVMECPCGLRSCAGRSSPQATCNACSTFSFSSACFTTSIISVT